MQPDLPGPASSERAGLYLHVPFCTSICPYCDFAVLIAGEERRREYLTRMATEAELYRGCGLVFDTVYVGGGTPSTLSGDQLGGLLEQVRSSLAIDPGARLHLEVNPEDVDPSRVREWRGLGATFVSLGVQSLNDEVLRRLGRRHDAARARRAATLLLEAGLPTVSLDLMYGLDGQSDAQWRRDLGEAVALGPQHLSCYQLTVHDGTVFGRRARRGELHELDDDGQGRLFELTHRFLADRGYEGYEVSNFAAGPEHRSRHNQKYWDHTPYLGLGPSAHSYQVGRRWWNRRKLRLWAADLGEGRRPLAGEEVLGREELALEAVLLGLRTSAGIDLERIRSSFGVDVVAANQERIRSWSARGLVRLGAGRLAPTVAGMAVADALAREVELPVCGG